MAYRYSVTEDDYILANRRHCARVFRTRRGWTVSIVGALVWTVVIGIDLDIAWPERLAIMSGLALLFAGGIWLGIVAVNALLMPRQARRLYRQTRALQASYALDWDMAALRFESERGVQMLPWSDFVKWSRAPEGLTLYVSDGMFYLLPARDIPVDARADIVAALHAHDIPEWRAWRRLAVVDDSRIPLH